MHVDQAFLTTHPLQGYLVLVKSPAQVCGGICAGLHTTLEQLCSSYMTQKTYTYRTSHLSKRGKGHLHIIEPTRGSQLTGKWGTWARFRTDKKSLQLGLTTRRDTLETRVGCLQSEVKSNMSFLLGSRNHNVCRATTTGIISCPKRQKQTR